MKKVSKVLLLVAVIALFFIIKAERSEAATYIWPVGGNNANETYKDYDFYGQANAAPYKNNKSGREYIVNNKLWPNEKYYYAKCESHFGMDITGKNGQTYKIVSVCNGTVIGTSGTRANSPSVDYVDRNQRRTAGGLNDGGGYGNYIIIQEPSTGRCFLYAHLKRGTLKVKKGDTVKAGQQIATMGSSGDSGHMHLHFEIRKSKAAMVKETIYGYHYLVITNSNTNLDPEQYIGSAPNVHTPVKDKKLVKISKEDAKLYIRYLYTNVIGREASNEEVEQWVEKYTSLGSISEVTKGIFLSKEANTDSLSNLDLSKKAYEVILFRGKNYTEKEMSGHVDKLNRGIWNRNDYITMLCNCNEFVNTKLNSIITKQKEIDNKKAEEERKKQEEEEKKKKEEEEKRKQEEEEKRRQEEEERKKAEEEAKKKAQEEKNNKFKLYVKYIYRATLGRAALDSETSYWVSQYENNVNIGEITKNIFICANTDYLDSIEFVKKAYKVILNDKECTDSESYYFSSRIDNGDISREDFIISICSSEEFNNNIYPKLVNKQNDYDSNNKLIAIALEDELKIVGDLDGDQKITARDVSLCLILRNLDDISGYEYAVYYADIDEDGRVTFMDVIYMLSYCTDVDAGKIEGNMPIKEYIVSEYYK